MLATFPALLIIWLVFWFLDASADGLRPRVRAGAADRHRARARPDAAPSRRRGRLVRVHRAPGSGTRRGSPSSTSRPRRAKSGPAVVDRRPVDRSQHAVGDVRGPRDLQEVSPAAIGHRHRRVGQGGRGQPAWPSVSETASRMRASVRVSSRAIWAACCRERCARRAPTRAACSPTTPTVFAGRCRLLVAFPRDRRRRGGGHVPRAGRSLRGPPRADARGRHEPRRPDRRGQGIVLDTSRHMNPHRPTWTSRRERVRVGARRRAGGPQPGGAAPQPRGSAPDTSTSNRATIGGMIGNNSSGATRSSTGPRSTTSTISTWSSPTARGRGCTPSTRPSGRGGRQAPTLEGRRSTDGLPGHPSADHAQSIASDYPKRLAPLCPFVVGLPIGHPIGAKGCFLKRLSGSLQVAFTVGS